MTSGQNVIESIASAHCTTCGWEGVTDVAVDLEVPRSMRTEWFVCPNGHENERPL